MSVRRPVLLVLVLVLVAGVIMPVSAGAIPPREDGIMRALRAQGVIPPKASARQAQAIYDAYIARKTGGKGEDPGNPEAAQMLAAAEKSGRPVQRHGQMRPDNKRYDTILTLLVEFAGTDYDAAGNAHTGPLHNEIEQPAADNNSDFWVEDFSTAHYQRMLFNKAPGAKSMFTYFLEQSGGTYATDGKVTAWVQLPHSEWYYGADGATGNDNLNGPVWRVVADAVAAAGDSVDWSDFDNEDIYDLDGDGVYNEPDGYVDHIQVIHAGADQAAGGGAQGDDAIWSHSWWVDYGSGMGPSCLGGAETSDGTWVGPYTINPEDGTVGVFVHEFSHDLGLPDQYDTMYSGEASTAFWTLMSSGSWLGAPGQPLGTSPSSLNAWEKWVLGWLEPTYVSPGQSKKVNLRTTTASGRAGKAVRVNLPSYSYSQEITEPYSGQYMWYSGSGDMLWQTLEITTDVLPAGAGVSFKAWYDIEQDWDYGYVEVSHDGGSTWTPLQTNLSTTSDPNGNNDGFGITGTSGGWVDCTADLSAYAGIPVVLRFRYETDEAVAQLGWAIDDITIGGFFDDVESGAGDWVADGWVISDGAVSGTANQYYIAELRQPVGFDVSMNAWYNVLPNGYSVEFFNADPGVLLWYRNTRYGDNFAGVHPWAGQLLAVDAHPELLTAAGSNWLGQMIWGFEPGLELPWRTRIQLRDATFGLKPTTPFSVSSWWGVPFPTNVASMPAVSTYDDSMEWVDRTYEPYFGVAPDYDYYLYAATPSADTPTHGLRFSVLKEKPGSADVLVDFTNFTP